MKFVRTILEATLPIALGLTSGLSLFWLLDHVEEWAAAAIAIMLVAASVVWLIHIHAMRNVCAQAIQELQADIAKLEAELKELRS